MPRAMAWHLAHRSHHPRAGDAARWKRDSKAHFCSYLLETHRHVELASIHPYVKRLPGTDGASEADEALVREERSRCWGGADRWGCSLSLVASGRAWEARFSFSPPTPTHTRGALLPLHPHAR